ncbi:FABP family protein [Rhodococcus sp. SGAir0479]|uniref:FABP family protein n=1 Tax=Rhodococcus sp. SGAir0479 TaxID=2567884 RepID=UPI0010CCBC62|nr:FABP family protein [Rhodococcus sp. SGAir0479]QCQ93151.1 FABP family protein [Rhodococcus sp. SGAir0479]
MAQTQTDLLAPLGELAAFAGRWVGGGCGHYPTIDDFAYDEEIELAPSGKPFLFYRSRTRKPGGGQPMHTETGYLRLTDGTVELLVTQPTGFVEIHRGELADGVLDFTEHVLAASPAAKPVHRIRRRLELTEGSSVLAYDMWMAFDEVPLTHHLRAALRRAD